MGKNAILGLPTSSKAINATAARVVRPASSLDKWNPQPKAADHMALSHNVLRTAPFPLTMPPEVRALVGQRRDRLTLLGYAADQGSAQQSAKWVVRCDCGNFEHRSRVVRWLGTHAPDMCRECRTRNHRTGRLNYPRDKAKRDTRA